MITKLELRNFTTFEKLDIDFSPRINVIIGENGTGKTQLLKAGYALSHTLKIDSEDIETTFTKRLVDIFMPLDDKLGKMRKNGATENASMKITFDKDETFKCSFHTNSQKIAVQDNQNYLEYKKEPVYIPTKEVLSFMKGFTSLYAKYDLSFEGKVEDQSLRPVASR
jgi:predicted ATP-binding protein involved in virulence